MIRGFRGTSYGKRGKLRLEGAVRAGANYAAFVTPDIFGPVAVLPASDRDFAITGQVIGVDAAYRV